MLVRVVEGIDLLKLFSLDLVERWVMGKPVLMSYLHPLGEGEGGMRNIHLGGRRTLPAILVGAVFAICTLTLSIKSQYPSCNYDTILTLMT